MKLSEKTLKVLKNFSEINNTIYIRSGSNLVTVDPQLRIVADVGLEETFPQDFAMYNLSEFLGVNSAQDGCELDFESDRIVFKSDSSKSRLEYFYSDPTTVQDAMPTRNKIPTVFSDNSIVHRFTISDSQLKSIRLNASLLSLTHITFVGSESSIQMIVRDLSSRSTQNKYTISLDSTSSGEYEQEFNMLFENLKIIPDSYSVELSPSVAHFTGVNSGIEYWIVLEAQ